MDKKKCEFCGEEILINSRRCPFCGSLVKEILSENQANFSHLPTEHEEQYNDECRYQGSEDQNYLSNEINKEKVGQYPCAGYRNNNPVYLSKRPLSNTLKVFIAAISAFPPGIGQLIGIVSAIIFMAEEGDADRKSYGNALLASSLIFFVVWGMVICCGMVGISVIGEMMENPEMYNY